MEKKGLKKLWSKDQEKELKDLADKGFFSKEDYENGKRLREAFGFKAKEKEYTQDLGSLVVSEEDIKEIEKDWSAWILKQAERGLIEADGLFDEEGERT
tara:strand:+ start:192 stop:488 length:297 start_codon:yes stop_codon:yes gene_type:complete